jgi:hypothetical protein
LEVEVSDKEALGGRGTTYVGFRAMEMSFVLRLREVLVNEERCEGRNKKQGGVWELKHVFMNFWAM